MDLINPSNEKYRTVAEYNQVVVPVAVAIEDVDWIAFERLVCDAYREDEARIIQQAWKETNGTRTGKLIRRCEDGGILKSINEYCEAGRPWYEVTLFSGGTDTVRILRERQRKAQPTKVFGAEKCKQLIAEFRDEMRIIRLAEYEALRATYVTPRLFLAERLNHSCRMVRHDLQKAVEYKAGQFLRPKQVGDLLGSIDYFWQCWREFHEAESPVRTPTPPTPQLLDTSAPTSPQPEIPESLPTVADLCLPPFEPTDLAALLMHLKVIKKSGGPPYEMITSLEGKGKSKISKVAAAFTVLSEGGLFSENKDDWSAASKSAYGIPLGAKVLGYQKFGNSQSFDIGIELTRKWLTRYLQKQHSDLKTTPY